LKNCQYLHGETIRFFRAQLIFSHEYIADFSKQGISYHYYAVLQCMYGLDQEQKLADNMTGETTLTKIMRQV